jgi:arylformamidase
VNIDPLDREYNPRVGVPDIAGLFARWQQNAREARERLPCRLDLQYGPAPVETLDLFQAPGPNRPLLIFIHGGYWRALDKNDFSWVAPAYVAAGFSVAVLNYGLAPATPLPEIVAQMRRACVWLHRNARDLEIDPLRIVCSGHSAGGHLTAMMLATDWTQISPELPSRLLNGAIAVSGLFDLAPVARAPFVRDDLRLDDALVRQLSPTLLPLHNDVPLLLAVGALETAEFHRQSQLIASHWPLACRDALLDLPEGNHYTACEALAAPGSALFQAVCSMLPRRPGAAQLRAG